MLKQRFFFFFSFQMATLRRNQSRSTLTLWRIRAGPSVTTTETSTMTWGLWTAAAGTVLALCPNPPKHNWAPDKACKWSPVCLHCLVHLCIYVSFQEQLSPRRWVWNASFRLQYHSDCGNYSDIFTQPRCVWCSMFSSAFLYLKLLILIQDIRLTQKTQLWGSVTLFIRHFFYLEFTFF